MRSRPGSKQQSRLHNLRGDDKPGIRALSRDFRALDHASDETAELIRIRNGDQFLRVEVVFDEWYGHGFEAAWYV